MPNEDMRLNAFSPLTIGANSSGSDFEDGNDCNDGINEEVGTGFGVVNDCDNGFAGEEDANIEVGAACKDDDAFEEKRADRLAGAVGFLIAGGGVAPGVHGREIGPAGWGAAGG